MLKCIGLTALAIAVAVLTLGCVRGLVPPTAPLADQIYMAKPVSVPAEPISSKVTGSVARHRHLPRQWAPADGRPDV